MGAPVTVRPQRLTASPPTRVVAAHKRNARCLLAGLARIFCVHIVWACPHRESSLGPGARGQLMAAVRGWMQTRVPWPPRLARLCPAPWLNQEAEEEVVLAKEKVGPCAVCRYSSSWSWPRLRPSKEALCVQTLASCHGWDASEVCSTQSLRGSPVGPPQMSTATTCS